MVNSIKNEKTIGITGASGALGKELTKLFRQKGYKVIGFTHSKTNYETNLESPNEWIKWKCGKESSLKKQLEKILEYIRQLEKIDTDNVPCTTRAIEVVNVFRKDEKKNSDCNEELLELGPSREDKYFKVPKIINE